MTPFTLSDAWRERLPALLAWSCLLLLPFGRLVEGPVLLMAMLGVVHALRHHRALFADARMRLLLLLFACYWLPMLLSVPDAVEVGRSASTTAVQLRFLFAGVYLVGAFTVAGLALFVRLSAWLLLFWMADALLQFWRGVDLFGFVRGENRLSGMFGENNSKFGLTLAVIVPLVWEWLRGRAPGWLFIGSVPAGVAFVMLAGSRAAWITVAATAAVYALALAWRARHLSRRGLLAGVLAGLVLAVASYHLSERVQLGVDEAVAGFTQQGPYLHTNSIYHRYWIWATAVAMFADNPVNGVGARNFRYGYPRYASPEDPFFHGVDGQTPTHSHQLLLETAAETGLLGLAGLLAMWVLIARAVLRGVREAPPLLLALAAGLAGAYFPLNTHLAVYSSYWSQILWWLIALFCVCAERGPARRTTRQ